MALGKHVRRIVPVSLGLGLLVHATAQAQHASDNAVTAAEDAFGLTVGLESIGLYGPGQIRGFNPQAAGNVRINGLFFDQQGSLSNRVLDGSAIRVGPSETGYAFPAPTGIVDYSLRRADSSAPPLTLTATTGPFEARGLSIDGNLPLLANTLQLPIGASLRLSTNTTYASNPGYTSHVVEFGATPEWKPSDRLTLRAIADYTRITDGKTLPLIFTAGDFMPPKVLRGYRGQNWATGESIAENFGGLVTAQLSAHWDLSAGLFRSISDNPVTWSDLYLNTQLDGTAEQYLIGYPEQSSASTSGEARLTGRFLVGSWRQEVALLARGRDTLAHYGGSDVVDAGPAFIGADVQVPMPTFVYAENTLDRTELYSVGLAYRIKWLGHGEFAAGIQRESYDKKVTPPGGPSARLSDRPLRLYANGAVAITGRLNAYGGYTQGLEDSGAVPASAQNRGTILPAARTWQADAGLQWLLAPKLRLIAGVFEIQKPYFNFDTRNVDRMLGVQRADGVEISISGEPIQHLSITAGAVLGQVSIIGPNLRAEGVGTNAFGQPHNQGVFNADYTIPSWPAASLDFSVIRFGTSPASVDTVTQNPAQTVLNVGGRYRFSVAGKPATIRVVINNLNNYYFWNMAYSPGFSQSSPRSVFAYLTADI
jgi:iron complex outermembrane receptor protein